MGRDHEQSLVKLVINWQKQCFDRLEMSFMAKKMIVDRNILCYWHQNVYLQEKTLIFEDREHSFV